MSIIANPETNQQLGYVVTFYKLDCPKCGTVNVGDDDKYAGSKWREGQPVACRRCRFTAEPETRKVDLAR